MNDKIKVSDELVIRIGEDKGVEKVVRIIQEPQQQVSNQVQEQIQEQVNKDIKTGETAVEGTIVVSRTWPPEAREERIQIRPFKTDVVRIAVSKGRTINVGDYNSVRVDITISLPCYMEEIDQTFEYCSKLAEQYLVKECQPIEEYVAGKGKVQ